MAYSVAWDIPGKVLYLKVLEEVSRQEFLEIDNKIKVCLGKYDTEILLVVDASQAKIAPYGIEQIKASQTYLQSRQIKQLLVISNNKLNRLVLLLLFNLCRPKLQFCDNFNQAQRFIEMSGT